MSETDFQTHSIHSGPAFIGASPSDAERAEFRDLCNIEQVLVLLDYWSSLYDSLGHIPAKRDILPEKIYSVLANTTLWKLVDEFDWEVLLVGEAAAEVTGSSVQPGKRLSEFASEEYLQSVAKADQRLVLEGAPILERGQTPVKDRSYFKGVSLSLPLLINDTDKVGFSISIFVRTV